MKFTKRSFSFYFPGCSFYFTRLILHSAPHLSHIPQKDGDGLDEDRTWSCASFYKPQQIHQLSAMPPQLIHAFPHPHLSFITLLHIRAAETFSASNRFLTTWWKQFEQWLIQLPNFLKSALIERETFSCQAAFWRPAVRGSWDSILMWKQGDWLKWIMQRSRNVSNISWGLTQSTFLKAEKLLQLFIHLLLQIIGNYCQLIAELMFREAYFIHHSQLECTKCIYSEFLQWQLMEGGDYRGNFVTLGEQKTEKKQKISQGIHL